MSKCVGCGVTLQYNYQDMLGYTNNTENKLCERCFRIKNYNDYINVNIKNSEFKKIIEYIRSTRDLVLFLIDLFNIPRDINEILNNIDNDVIFVLTKRDLLPLSLKDDKLMDYFSNYHVKDKIIISSNKNYNLDLLMDMIYKYKKSNNIYVVGMTNAGKSTLINKIIYNYTESNDCITTSNLPSTTLDMINIRVNDTLNIIDTPGLLSDQKLLDNINKIKIKKIIPTREIKPITYQIKTPTTIIVDEFLNIFIKDNVSITFYISNKLKVERKYKYIDDKIYKYIINSSINNEIVLDSIGFIKINNKCDIIITSNYELDIYTREALI